MPNTGLPPLEYKRLRERLYYRRVYKVKKMAMVKIWQAKNPEKVLAASLKQRTQNK